MDVVKFGAIKSFHSLTSNNDTKPKPKVKENKKEIQKQIYNLLRILERFCAASHIVDFLKGELVLEKCCDKRQWLIDAVWQKCGLILKNIDNSVGEQVTYVRNDITNLDDEYNLNINKFDYLNKSECLIDMLLSATNPSINYLNTEGSYNDDAKLFDVEDDCIDLSGLNFSNINLQNIEFHGYNFHNADLSDTNLKCESLLGSNLIGVIYVTVDPTFSNYDPYIAIWCLISTSSEQLRLNKRGLNDDYSHRIKMNLKCLNRFLEESSKDNLKREISCSKEVKLLLTTRRKFVESVEFIKFKRLCFQLNRQKTPKKI